MGAWAYKCLYFIRSLTMAKRDTVSAIVAAIKWRPDSLETQRLRNERVWP